MATSIKTKAKQVDKVFSELSSIKKRQDELVDKVIKLWPIKYGDKVSIKDIDKNHLRFAFIGRIEVKFMGQDRKPYIAYTLYKCKANGMKSNHQDNLHSFEYVSQA